MCTKYVFALNLLILCLYLPASQQKALDAKHHLFMYGYVDSPNPDDKAMKEGLKKFQKAAGLDVTGDLNESTMKKMSGPRCGRTSNTPLFLSAPNKWRKPEITYKVQNWTEPFTKPQVKKFFDDSAKAWTNGVNLTIKETSSDNGDINVHFSEQDGGGNVLGYAFFPENGDIYFDKDEDWTVRTSLARRKIYFGWVAAHEMGHSLGLPHSETMRSIMFPYYSETVGQPADIDINNLKRLYGEAPPDKTLLCQGKSNVICAMLNIDDNIIIKQKQYWTLSSESITAGPFPVDSLFPGLPDTIDAAFAVRKTVYFLKDNIFYKFTSGKSTLQPKLISVGFEGVPSGINAAFFDPSSRIIYFFKGSKYYAFDTTKATGKRLTVDGKSVANDWNGIPNDVEAAILVETNKALFIKDSRCYTVEMSSRELLSNQDCKTTLFKC